MILPECLSSLIDITAEAARGSVADGVTEAGLATPNPESSGSSDSHSACWSANVNRSRMITPSDGPPEDLWNNRAAGLLPLRPSSAEKATVLSQFLLPPQSG